MFRAVLSIRDRSAIELRSKNMFQPANTPITGPFSRAGFAVIDGVGKLVITSTASRNGLIFPEVFDVTYRVKPDCTFTYIANLGAPINSPVQCSGVIYEGGKRADFMLANPPGTTTAATIVQQDKKAARMRIWWARFLSSAPGR